MPHVDLASLAFDHDPADPDGFRAGMARLGPRLGAEQTGVTIYELPPGQAVCPYHYEYGEEEWVLVLSGRPSVRTPGGVEELAPGALMFFPRGPRGAIRSATTATSRRAWRCSRTSCCRPRPPIPTAARSASTRAIARRT